jgi:Uma2 family endonuclease
MVQSPVPAKTGSDRATELAECGFRTITITNPDGTVSETVVPLSSEEFLHPEEGYHLPNSTFHDTVAGDAKDILTRRYANDPTVGVFRDLLIQWDVPDLKDHCPDTFVAFGISNKQENRTKFIIADEVARPTFILEVVSRRYRKEDREIKVVEYARGRVQEYVIIDRRTQRGQVLDEVLGYRLVEAYYQPISPDEDGFILCQTIGVRIGLQEGHLVMEDAQTGERLLTSQELAAANQELAAANQELAATNQELAATNQELAVAKQLAEQQAAEMAALLAQYRDRFGNLSENSSNG